MPGTSSFWQSFLGIRRRPLGHESAMYGLVLARNLTQFTPRGAASRAADRCAGTLPARRSRAAPSYPRVPERFTMSDSQPPEVVDFHVHYVNPAHPPTLWADAKPEVAELRRRTTRRIVDLDDVLASAAAGSIATRVLNTPPSLVALAGTALPARVVREINDHLAAQVAAHPQRLLGLATIEAWQGEEAADEVRRAVTELGLPGIVVDAAADGGDRLLDHPDARPVLRAAAELGVPVFVHPINPRGFTEQLEPAGRAGHLLARGAIDAASLLALLHSDVYDELPGLRIVIPLIGSPALLIGAFTGLTTAISRHAPAQMRRHVYVDPLGFDPASIRYLVDVVGADHVLVGSDSPIVAESIDRDAVLAALAALAAAGLDRDEIAAVAGGNARRLLGAGAASAAETAANTGGQPVAAKAEGVAA